VHAREIFVEARLAEKRRAIVGALLHEAHHGLVDYLRLEPADDGVEALDAQLRGRGRAREHRVLVRGLEERQRELRVVPYERTSGWS